MRGRKKLYKIVDQNGKQVFEDLFNCQQAAEKIGTTKQNVYQAVENYALVNKKYRIIPEDTKLSRKKQKRRQKPIKNSVHPLQMS